MGPTHYYFHSSLEFIPSFLILILIFWHREKEHMCMCVYKWEECGQREGETLKQFSCPEQGQLCSSILWPWVTIWTEMKSHRLTWLSCPGAPIRSFFYQRMVAVKMDKINQNTKVNKMCYFNNFFFFQFLKVWLVLKNCNEHSGLSAWGICMRERKGKKRET